MSLGTLGDVTFRDKHPAVPGKSEFGMDTLVRHVEGFVGEDGENLQAFIESLNQGDTYEFGNVPFYLQTWTPDDETPVCTVTLNYKGLTPGGTPETDKQREFVTAKGVVSKSFSELNLGKGIPYTTRAVYRSFYEMPTGGQDDLVVGHQSVYTVSARMEFTYIAPQVTFRYISEGEPVAARHDSVGFDYTLIIDDGAVIVTGDGAILGRDFAQFFGLSPVPVNRVISFSAKNVIGSPFWECQDVLRLELGEVA